MQRTHLRLRALAALVPPGVALADIGTDHGLLPLALLREGRIRSAIGVDLRPGPLQGARARAAAWGLAEDPRLQLRLGDGLRALRPGEADAVVLAGMGGERILQLLREGGAVLDGVGWLLLHPDTHPERLRPGLGELGFQLDRERLLVERGRVHVLMRAARGEGRPLDPVEALCGPLLLRTRDPGLRCWVEERLRRAEERAAGGHPSEELRLLRQALVRLG